MGGGGMPQLPPGMSREQVMQMQNMLPPEVKAQLRQPGGRERLMQQLQSGQMPPGMAGMMPPGMGGGGGGGMPDLGSLMSSMGGMGGMASMMKNMIGGGGGGGR